MKIIFKPNHGHMLAECMRDYTLVAEGVSDFAEHILSKDFVLFEKFQDKEEYSYNRDWLRYDKVDADERVGFIEAYDVFAGAHENLETEEVKILEPCSFIGTIAVVDDDWSVDKYSDSIAGRPTPGDDLEEVDVEDAEEVNDVFSLSDWLKQSLSHVIFLFLVVAVIAGMIVGVKYVYDALGSPNEKQQTGVGLLEWEKD